jgi:ribosome biogenesis GTPase / thiamine phosphate phosphatase
VERLHTLEPWGWSEFFASQLSEAEWAQCAVARIVEPARGLSRAVCAAGEIWAEQADGISPAVGDWIVGRLRDQGAGEKRMSTERILRRYNKVSRVAPGGQGYEQVLCANVDAVFIVVAVSQVLHLPGVERALEVVREAGILPAIILTKADEEVDTRSAVEQIQSVAAGAVIHLVSVKQNRGLEVLPPFFDGDRTVVLLGASGAGKSTLTNYLLSHEIQKVGEVREDDQKGRHTTTGRRLHRLQGGGMVIDSPGIREIQKWEGGEFVPKSKKKTKPKSIKNSRSRRAAQEED